MKYCTQQIIQDLSVCTAVRALKKDRKRNISMQMFGSLHTDAHSKTERTNYYRGTVIRDFIGATNNLHRAFLVLCSGVFRFCLGGGVMILSSSPTFKVRGLKLGLHIIYSLWGGGDPPRKYVP